MVRGYIERAVTKQDYFHQFHAAEPDNTDPERSYYYDLRARAHYDGPFNGALPVIDYRGITFTNPVHAAQYGIAHLQHYWDSGEEKWFDRAHDVARALVASAAREGASLVWRYPVPTHGACNWLSAMAQGQVASLLLRVAAQTGDTALRDSATAALEPFFHDIDSSGVRAELDGHVWFEEYAFEPVPFTLNGFIVALLGLRDATCLLEPAREEHIVVYRQGLTAVSALLPRFDARGWSRYDLLTQSLLGMQLRNLASPFYHRFHVELLSILAGLEANERIDTVRRKWKLSLTSGVVFYTATAEKALYRLLTPNAQALASTRARHRM